MKYWCFLFALCLIVNGGVYSQTPADTTPTITYLNTRTLLSQIEWEVDFDIFLDNREFDNPYTLSESMLGAWVTPSLGYTFAPGHSVYGGVGLLQEFGFSHLIDDYVAMLFYQYQGDMFKLHVGSFPRRDVIKNYDLILFADEVAYHNPNVMGVHWGFKQSDITANMWLDWTSKQTEQSRETFILGSDLRWQPGYFLLGYRGYIHHYASFMNDPAQTGRVLDNGMLLMYTGVDFTHNADLPFDLCQVEAGYVREFARIRGVTDWITPSGLLLTAQLEWRGLGLKNTTYKGAGQFEFRDIDRYGYGGPSLYWGDAWYQNSLYNRTDLILTFFETEKVHTYFDWGFHMAGGTVSVQQQFFVRINFGSRDGKLRKGRRPLIWDDLLNLAKRSEK